MIKRILQNMLRAGGLQISRHDKKLALYASLYERHQTHTMIPRNFFIQNLQLCGAFSHVPGDFVECGVWKGGMSAAVSEVLGKDRIVHLFDSFEGLPPARPIDGKAALEWQKNTEAPGYFDNCTAEEGFAVEAMQRAGHVNYVIHKGWFDKTLPGSLQQPIGILRLDGDWYDSIMVCLQHLFPKVSNGGIVILDDYYVWDGCAKAVHDYLSTMQSPSRIYQWNNSVPFILKTA